MCVDLILVFCLFFLFQLDGACGDGAGGLGFFPGTGRFSADCLDGWNFVREV